jgi:hypothetical protein
LQPWKLASASSFARRARHPRHGEAPRETGGRAGGSPRPSEGEASPR